MFQRRPKVTLENENLTYGEITVKLIEMWEKASK